MECRLMTPRLSEKEIEDLHIQEIDDDDNIGYVLECDLLYPKELHDLHNQYPLTVEQRVIPDGLLSPYSKRLWENLHSSPQSHNDELHPSRPKTSKLITSLESKQNYILHFRNLKLYLNLGLKLAKIHRAIKFSQSPWLRPYIQFNTEMRKKANDEFEKSFFKLMNNAVFGKTMENLRKRVDIKLVHTEKKMQRQVSKSSFKRFNIFNEHLVGVENRKVQLCLNKPVYVGQVILDISKLLMYRFHYDFVLRRYGSNAQLLFTDTDSLCYHIKTDNVYEDMNENKHLFDLSNFTKEHPLYDTSNKRVPGLFKDETGGVPILEFVGLHSKMYSFTYGDTEKNTAKGIEKGTIRRDIRHEHYKSCLFDKKVKMCSMNTIRSTNHSLSVQTIVKSGLSAFDDKRYILDCGITSLAYGHYKIQQTNN